MVIGPRVYYPFNGLFILTSRVLSGPGLHGGQGSRSGAFRLAGSLPPVPQALAAVYSLSISLCLFLSVCLPLCLCLYLSPSLSRLINILRLFFPEG